MTQKTPSLNGGLVRFEARLIEQRLVTPANLATARQHAENDTALPDALVSLNLLPESDVYRALADAFELEFIDLSLVTPNELAIRLVPERLARRHNVVPLSVDSRTLTYATPRPCDPEAERDLAFASGRRTRVTVAPASDVLESIDRCYPKMHEVQVLAARLDAEQPRVENLDAIDAQPSGSTNAATVVDLCNRILGRAVEVGASDVHIECGNSGTTVRYRICGVLEPVLSLPAGVSQPIRNRLKIMARADISVRHAPQDGAFRIRVNGRPIDVRLSTLPTIDGEKIVMRVIDSVSPLQTLDRLGYDIDTRTRLVRSLARPDGMVLVTGPTGSGKTTALYSALGHLRTGRTNIITVEDPVERTLPGVTQIPVNVKAGSSFAKLLRSMLRQDPNIIMVGEVRDEEVAKIVGQAAYTGHLVLSSMHTADAATAVTRLANLGLEPYKIAETLSAVLAQRLVRSLCPHCKKTPTAFEARRAAGLNDVVPAASIGQGCEHCNHTGYRGRVPVAELLTPSDELRNTIARGATAHEIRLAMRAAGSPTMRDNAMILVAQGVTTIEEVDRVLSNERGEASAQVQAKRRVLVSDDEPITRMLIKLLLERADFEIIEATNGLDAVKLATRERPDLLLMDLNMPGMNGFEAIERLRKDLSMATLPIVVLTAEEGPGVERRVLSLGADDYIPKPFDADVLISRVNAVFRRLNVMAA